MYPRRTEVDIVTEVVVNDFTPRRCELIHSGGTRLCTVPILKLPPLELLHRLSMVSHLTLLGIECWGEHVLKAMIVLASMYESQSNTWVGM